jgi:hypothetical protein
MLLGKFSRIIGNFAILELAPPIAASPEVSELVVSCIYHIDRDRPKMVATGLTKKS